MLKNTEQQKRAVTQIHNYYGKLAREIGRWRV